jgi:hypothetical protein
MHILIVGFDCLLLAEFCIQRRYVSEIHWIWTVPYHGVTVLILLKTNSSALFRQNETRKIM